MAFQRSMLNPVSDPFSCITNGGIGMTATRSSRVLLGVCAAADEAVMSTIARANRRKPVLADMDYPSCLVLLPVVHDVLDGAVLSGCIRGLKDEQHAQRSWACSMSCSSASASTAVASASLAL